MARKTLTCVVVTTLYLAAAPLPAGHLQKTEVSPQANWVVHADCQAFRDSIIGKLVRAELKARGVEAQFQDFATIFGFNPLEDLRDVTLYGKGQDREKAAVLIDAPFDRERLLALVRTNPEYQEIPHGNMTLHRWLQEEKKGGEKTTQIMYGGICEERLVVISAGLEAVKHAVDVLQGAEAGDSTGLLDRIPDTESGVFFQVAATDVGEMVGQEPKAAVLRQTDSLALTVGETRGRVVAHVRLNGQSEQVAQNMAKVLEGILALAALVAEEQPKLAELARDVKLSQKGRTTEVHFEAESQSVFNFLKEQWEQKRQQQDQTQ